MERIADWLSWADQQLLDVSDSARLDAQLLLCHVLQKPRSFLYAWPEQVLSSEQQAGFRDLIGRRRQGVPVAHLCGEREFWSLPLRVNEHTLIPRPDTELLVELSLSLLPETGQLVADLGTGSGAIALALASERPHWHILAVDRSAQALAVAKDNARALQLNNVQCLQSDWGAALTGRGFHLLVSNPPYIAEDDPHLHEGDLRFEPHSALVAAEQGLADILTIISQARQLLLAGGWLLLEHGFQQGEAVRDHFRHADFTDIRSERDLAGHERVTLGRWSGGSPTP